jgi:hypothetical protein
VLVGSNWWGEKVTASDQESKTPHVKPTCGATAGPSSGKSQSQNPHPFRKNREKDGPPAPLLQLSSSHSVFILPASFTLINFLWLPLGRISVAC